MVCKKRGFGDLLPPTLVQNLVFTTLLKIEPKV